MQRPPPTGQCYQPHQPMPFSSCQPLKGERGSSGGRPAYACLIANHASLETTLAPQTRAAMVRQQALAATAQLQRVFGIAGNSSQLREKGQYRSTVAKVSPKPRPPNT